MCPLEAEIHLNGAEVNVNMLTMEAFLYHLEISTKLAFASLSSCLSRIKVGVFKDRLFYILNGFSVEVILLIKLMPPHQKVFECHRPR